MLVVRVAAGGSIKIVMAPGRQKPLEVKGLLGTLSIHLHLPGCASLKEKRGRIKPLMARLRREFNLSVAEVDLQDTWQQAVIGCAMIGNEQAHLESVMQIVARWVDANWTDGDVIAQKVELIL